MLRMLDTDAPVAAAILPHKFFAHVQHDAVGAISMA